MEIFFASSFTSKIILLRLEASFSSAEMASKISRFFSLVSIVSSFLDDAMRRNTASFFVVVVVVVVVFDAEDDDEDKDESPNTPRTPNLFVASPNDDGLVKKRERHGTPTKVAFASTR